jgi:hypothetical protein
MPDTNKSNSNNCTAASAAANKETPATVKISVKNKKKKIL